MSSQVGPCSNLPDKLIRAWFRVCSHWPLTADTVTADKVGRVNRALSGAYIEEGTEGGEERWLQEREGEREGDEGEERGEGGSECEWRE